LARPVAANEPPAKDTLPGAVPRTEIPREFQTV